MKQLKILVAEDSVFVQKVLAAYFDNNNHTCSIVNEGKTAFDLLKKEHFDLVFLDIEMPILDGIDTLKCIRNIDNEKTKNTLVYALTGHNDEFFIKNLMKIGFNGFINKSDFFIELNKLINLFNVPCNEEPPNNEIKNDKQNQIDLDYLRQFSNNDEEFVKEMLFMFYEETPEVIKDLQKHLGEQNWNELRQTAHRFSPRLSYLGLHELKNTFTQIETFSKKNEDRTKLKVLVNIIETDCKQILEKLQTEFNFDNKSDFFKA